MCAWWMNLGSIALGMSALLVAAIAALLLTLARSPERSSPAARERAARLLLVGIACQCAHFAEEFLTRFYERLPALLGRSAWSSDFFVVFNVFWIGVWVLCALGVRAGFRPAFFPVWFFAIAMVGNGIAHPALAIAARGYFPGLVTAPVVAIAGLALGRELLRLTHG
jgi:hypothetical protein